MPGPRGDPEKAVEEAGPALARGGRCPGPAWKWQGPALSILAEVSRGGSPVPGVSWRGAGARRGRERPGVTALSGGQVAGGTFCGDESGPSLGMWQGLVPGPSGRESPAGRPFPQPRPQGDKGN